jgi:hypothetical protein
MVVLNYGFYVTNKKSSPYCPRGLFIKPLSRCFNAKLTFSDAQCLTILPIGVLKKMAFKVNQKDNQRFPAGYHKGIKHFMPLFIGLNSPFSASHAICGFS